MKDHFDDFTQVQGYENVAQRREYPRIVTRPDVRVNPTTPDHYTHHGKACGYGWFPFILRTHRGTLLCIMRECLEHVYDDSGRAVVCRSTDGGRTWSMPILLYKKDKYTCGAYGCAETPDGTIWVSSRNQFYDRSKGAANDSRAWKMDWAVVCSRDDGLTWKRLPGRTRGWPALVMSNGELLWIGQASDPDCDVIRATYTTEMRGRKLEWTQRPHPELGPTSDEWHFVETDQPGTLVAMMRQQQHSQFYATSHSYDYGKTWEPWRESNVFMGPFPTRPMLRKANDGTLLFCYGQRWIGRTFVVPSHDGGRTWDIAHRQVNLHAPRTYHNVWDSHYTDVAYAEGSKYLAVDYIASPAKRSQKGLYGTFIDARHFRDAYTGVALMQRGSCMTPQTRGYWNFDELEGDFANDHVAGNYGEIHHAERAPGRFGHALRFEGRKSHVLVYDDAAMRLPKHFTLEAWIHIGASNRDQTILSKDPKYTLGLTKGRLTLRIGDAVMIDDSGKKVQRGRWTHVAATFGMRNGYSRATFFIDGKETGWVSPPTSIRSEKFHEAMIVSDSPIAGGALFQEHGGKVKSSDCLVIGMDNNLRTGGFRGLIDEVAIHAEAHTVPMIAASAGRSAAKHGSITSLPIEAAGTFTATVTEPEGTKIRFSVENEVGNVLLRNVKSGARLSQLDAPHIVLRADLSSRREGLTPVLHQWSTEPGDVIERPWPTDAPDESRAERKGRGKVVL